MEARAAESIAPGANPADPIGSGSDEPSDEPSLAPSLEALTPQHVTPLSVVQAEAAAKAETDGIALSVATVELDAVTHLDAAVHPDAATQVGTGLKVTPEGWVSADRWQTWFQQWLQLLYPTLPLSWRQTPHYELSLRLTGAPEIHGFNLQYRNIDRPTDVLAFAALEGEMPPVPVELMELPSEPLYLGDILIAVPIAQDQAQAQGHSLLTELVWLAAHGFLHLLGWDHPDDAQLQAMLQQQHHLLTHIGIPSPHWDAGLDWDPARIPLTDLPSS